MRRFWLWPVAAAATGALALPTLSVLAAPMPRPTIAVPIAEIAPITIRQIPSGLPMPTYHPTAIIFTYDGDTYRALSNRSTHRGCRVEQWESTDKLYDVCYHSFWSLDNQVVAGPAPRGLDSYPVTIKDGWIAVDLSRPQSGPRRP